MRRAKRGGKSLRERRIESNRSLDFLRAMYGDIARGEIPRNEIAPRRQRAKTMDNKPKRTAASESAVNKQIQDVAKDLPDVKLWRNNRGIAQYDNYMVRYGVGPQGASDWIGYKRMVVTPAMVGHELAVFVAIEAKRPGEKLDPDQEKFLNRVSDDGGIAGVARDKGDAIDILGR